MSRIQNILVPIDFSQNSCDAISYACEIAKLNQAVLHLLYVSNGEFDDDTREINLKKLHRLINVHSELQLVTKPIVQFGRPAVCITNYAAANNIDAIIMGTHGRTGLARFAIGSVTEQVIKNSTCPVTVLGPQERTTVSLTNAIAVIEPLVSEGLDVDESEGYILFAKVLVEKLDVSMAKAIVFVDYLIDEDWLLWEEGRWKFVVGIEFLDGAEIPMSFNESDDSQAIDLVKRAIKLRATDVHIDPLGTSGYRIRLRIDGELCGYCELDQAIGEHLISQLKVLAGLDIADPFHVQEGRLNLPSTMRQTQVRLSVVPVIEGHAAAMRILDPIQILKPLDSLGFSADGLAVVESMCQTSGGLTLVTGPTGAGKTTTIYSMLETLSSEKTNIVSIEDPVEFSADFVRQISVDTRNGLTMSAGVKSLLRMDPDVIFIGEIRDGETAKLALRAANSGKSVYSTMHTRDVASTIQALSDLGLDRRSFVNQLSGIISQKITRRLCPTCREPIPVNEQAANLFQAHEVDLPDQLFQSPGCEACKFTGAYGLIGIFEYAVVDRDFQTCIQESCSNKEIRKHLAANGTPTLTQDALTKAASGKIAIDQAVAIQWVN